MKPSQLRAFHAVARSGSFTQAAEVLNVSQPAVSDHVRKLEQACGASLFIRQPRGVQMTELGRKLYALTEKSAEVEQEVTALLSKAKELEVGSLTIGADAATHVMPLVKLFRARHPGITVKLLGGNSAGLVERLQAFEIDFAVVGRVPDVQGLVALPLSSSAMVAIVPTRSPLARRKSLSLRDLAQLPLVVREQGSHTRDLMFHAFKKLGLEWQVALEVESREACFEAVAEGLGPAFVSAGELPHDRRIKSVPISDRVEAMGEWLVHLQSRANLRLVQALVDVAREPGGRPR
jgi:aminoethylphosphonate catabolism LysR family transcriptional regulator